ncbi:MAG: hypothetical protein IKB98_00295 [Clostridia bacterium]|nr:hypothetical protein [Clostridia bacterium]
MTRQEREEILMKDYLTAEDLMQLIGVDLSKAYTIIRDIRRKTDRLGIQGKVHIQDYIDYYQLDVTRYQ